MYSLIALARQVHLTVSVSIWNGRFTSRGRAQEGKPNLSTTLLSQVAILEYALLRALSVLQHDTPPRAQTNLTR